MYFKKSLYVYNVFFTFLLPISLTTRTTVIFLTLRVLVFLLSSIV